MGATLVNKGCYNEKSFNKTFYKICVFELSHNEHTVYPERRSADTASPRTVAISFQVFTWKKAMTAAWTGLSLLMSAAAIFTSCKLMEQFQRWCCEYLL